MAIQPFVVLSVLITTAFAQTSSSPLIPSDITTDCKNFLQSFDTLSSFSSCTSPILSALSQYTPSGNASASLSNIDDVLNNLCSSAVTSQCPDTTLSSQLGSFYAACSAELTSTLNVDVLRMYEILYVLGPLRKAICGKDDSGKYCATELGSSKTASGAGSVNAVTGGTNQQALLEKYLYTTTGSGNTVTRRDSSASAAFIPNVTTYQDTNLVFLFLQPSTDSTTLCTSCTRSILSSFITFESSYPYAPGLNNSLFLHNQPSLYNSVTSTCGANFLSGAVQAAGGLSASVLSDGGLRSFSHDASIAVGAILGAAAFAVASF
ncbi:hypothetical protein ID866_2783 [Astraeus odoratus]|nr:hypothetical protein ID866_2783 [Astraeus odoratus]